MRLAGADRELFTSDALAFLHETASGALRDIDRIATAALHDAARRKKKLIERFSNPEIRDTVARLCAESSDRIPKWLLPVIRKNLESGGEITRSTAVVASWARYAEAVDEAGEPIDIVDQLKDSLVPIAQGQRENPTAFIANRAVFGDLIDNERFVAEYTKQLASLQKNGARATLEALMSTR